MWIVVSSSALGGERLRQGLDRDWDKMQYFTLAWVGIASVLLVFGMVGGLLRGAPSKRMQVM